MKKNMSGFTLMELLIIIILLWILATLGYTQYAKVVEQGRSVEAMVILGQLRTAQEAYNHEYGVNSTNFSLLLVDAPTACVNTHYFRYATDDLVGTATRCTAAGRIPDYRVEYTINLTYSTSVMANNWNSSAGNGTGP